MNEKMMVDFIEEILPAVDLNGWSGSHIIVSDLIDVVWEYHLQTGIVPESAGRYIETLIAEWIISYPDHEQGFTEWLKMEYYEVITEVAEKSFKAFADDYNEALPDDDPDDAAYWWWASQRGV